MTVAVVPKEVTVPRIPHMDHFFVLLLLDRSPVSCHIACLSEECHKLAYFLKPLLPQRLIMA